MNRRTTKEQEQKQKQQQQHFDKIREQTARQNRDAAHKAATEATRLEEERKEAEKIKIILSKGKIENKRVRELREAAFQEDAERKNAPEKGVTSKEALLENTAFDNWLSGYEKQDVDHMEINQLAEVIIPSINTWVNFISLWFRSTDPQKIRLVGENIKNIKKIIFEFFNTSDEPQKKELIRNLIKASRDLLRCFKPPMPEKPPMKQEVKVGPSSK